MIQKVNINTKNIFFFNGNDFWVTEKKLRELRSRIPDGFMELAYRIIDGKDIPNCGISDDAATPAFGCPSKIFYIRDYNHIKNNKPLLHALESCYENNFILLTQNETKMNKDIASFCAGKKNIVTQTLYPPSEKELYSRISSFFSSRSIHISDMRIRSIIRRFDFEYQNLSLELEKICLFIGENTDPNGAESLNDAAIGALLGKSYTAAVFETVSSFLSRNPHNIIREYLTFTAGGGDLLQLQAVLAAEILKLIRYSEIIQNGGSEEKAFLSAQIFHYQAKEKIRTIRHLYRLPELYRLYDNILQLEIILKSRYIVNDSPIRRKIHFPGQKFLLKTFLNSAVPV